MFLFEFVQLDSFFYEFVFIFSLRFHQLNKKNGHTIVNGKINRKSITKTNLLLLAFPREQVAHPWLSFHIKRRRLVDNISGYHLLSSTHRWQFYNRGIHCITISMMYDCMRVRINLGWFSSCWKVFNDKSGTHINLDDQDD